MKVFFICLDAFPHTSELQSILSQHLTRHELICNGGYTSATMSSMISGLVGTEMMKGGIGYHSLYTPEFHEWRKTRISLPQIFQRNGFKVFIHNNVPWMDNVILGHPPSFYKHATEYRQHKFFTNGTKHPEHDFLIYKTADTIYTSSHETMENFTEWSNVEKKQQFYRKEAQYIQWIQSQTTNCLVWIDHCQWHEAVYYSQHLNKEEAKKLQEIALEDTYNWLTLWNFKKNIFFLYADHSHQVQPFLDPAAYFTWCYSNQLGSSKQILATMDFYTIIQQLISHTRICVPSKIGRIFTVEDNRAKAETKLEATTRLCGMFLPPDGIWLSLAKVTKTKLCKQGYYLCLTKLHKRNSFTCYYFLDKKHVLHFNYDSVHSFIASNSIEKAKKTTDIVFAFQPEYKLFLITLLNTL